MQEPQRIPGGLLCFCVGGRVLLGLALFTGKKKKKERKEGGKKNGKRPTRGFRIACYPNYSPTGSARLVSLILIALSSATHHRQSSTILSPRSVLGRKELNDRLEKKLQDGCLGMMLSRECISHGILKKEHPFIPQIPRTSLEKYHAHAQQ